MKAMTASSVWFLLFLVVTSCLVEPIQGQRRQYKQHQVFVIDVLGECINEQLAQKISATVQKIALKTFASRFGPYRLVPPGTSVTTTRNGNDRRLVDSCPSNCNTEQNRKICVAQNCVTSSSGQRRRQRRRQRRLRGASNQCYFFNPGATLVAMNRALAELSSECDIRLKARITPVEKYAKLSQLAKEPTKVNEITAPTPSSPGLSTTVLTPLLTPAQCPLASTCVLTPSPTPSVGPPLRLHPCA